MIIVFLHHLKDFGVIFLISILFDDFRRVNKLNLNSNLNICILFSFVFLLDLQKCS